MSTFSWTPSDTGLTHTESVVTNRTRVVADTGLTFSESLVRNARRFRTLSDTGSTITSTLPKTVRHALSDTGTTFVTTAPSAVVVPAPNAVFTYLCSRNWNFIENQPGWSYVARARFTYTTIPD